MTFTIGQILEAQPALQKLVGASLPAIISFRVAQLIWRLNPEIEATQPARLAASRKYGTEEDGQIRVSPERLPELLAELAPLLATTITIEIQPLPQALLENAPDMTVQEMMALLPFMEQQQ